MAQIAPSIVGPDHGAGQFAAPNGHPVNQSPGGDAVQPPNNPAYQTASPGSYGGSIYPTTVVPYGTSSLSGANILPALYPPPGSSAPPAQPEPPTPSASVTIGKRKPDQPSPAPRKRRQALTASGEERDDADVGPNGGPKHWTDSEKNSLFHWLMVDDIHWEMFKSKMNVVFRDASRQIFGGRKSFTALKSCYHRNIETFKQIFLFEMFLARSVSENNPQGEALFTEHESIMARQTYLEQRLEDARLAGVAVGNINVKVIEHWHQNGWYVLFKSRFREDPRTGVPVPYFGSIDMSFGEGPSAHAPPQYHPTTIDPQLTNGAMGEEDDDEDEHVDNEYHGSPEPPPETHPIPDGQATQQPVPKNAIPREIALMPPHRARHFPARSIQPPGQNTARMILPAPGPVPSAPAPAPVPMSGPADPPVDPSSIETIRALDRLTVAMQALAEQSMVLTQLLRAEASERKTWSVESGERKEEGLNRKEKAALATEMLANGDVGDEVRKAAADYLKRLFMGE